MIGFAFFLLITVLGMLAAFVLGYKAGRHEERLISIEPGKMDVVNTEEEGPATVDENKIREDIERSRLLITGFDGQ